MKIDGLTVGDLRRILDNPLLDDGCGILITSNDARNSKYFDVDDVDCMCPKCKEQFYETVDSIEIGADVSAQITNHKVSTDGARYLELIIDDVSLRLQ